jgi:hypothetical protein
VRGTADDGVEGGADTWRMQPRARDPIRYPAAFREGDGPIAVGAVVVEADCVLLEGRHQEELFRWAVLYEDLVAVRLGHRTRERLNGCCTLVLLRRAAPPLEIAPLGFGLRWELADTLDERIGRRGEATERVAIVVPLRHGSVEQVRALLAEGPPFDVAAQGLSRHDVFLASEEAVFVLEGRDVHEILWRAIGEPGFWQAGKAWRGYTAGAPWLSSGPFVSTGTGELVYSWVADQS